MERSASEAGATHNPGALGWAAPALVLTAAIAIGAKILGVLVAPGLRGVVRQSVVELAETASATLAYTLAALLVSLVCAASFELARARRVGVVARGAVVALSGLVVALASPAVVQRLHTVGSIALALTTGVIALVAGIVSVRVSHTRALGAVLAILAICTLLRVVAWEMATVGSEHPSPALHTAGRVLATFAVVFHAVGVLVGAAWIATRSRRRGRILANASILLAFAVTYLAARTTESPPSTLEAVLRGSLAEAAGVPIPYALAAVGTFLLPASILLAAAALFQRGSPIVVSALALAFLSHGSFDVPLHALAVTTAAQWTLLAMADGRSTLTELVAQREHDEPRTTA